LIAQVEAEQLSGCTDWTQAPEALLERYPECKAVVLTLGEQGALITERGQEAWHIPAVENVTALDTVGAGDAFLGGLAAAMALGRSFSQSCTLANAMAAKSVAKAGTQGSYSSVVDVDPASSPQ